MLIKIKEITFYSLVFLFLKMVVEVPKEKIKIRKATKKDLKNISDIFRKETSKKPYLQKWTQKTAVKKINEFFERDDIYLISVEEEIVGFIILKISVGENGKSAFIDELWLKSNYQGKGIGITLMNYIEDTYKDKGIKSIYLISDIRSNAFYFYKKLKYNPYNDFVLMAKKLNKST